MAADEDAELLSAAMTIRDELVTLVPADADALGAALDEHITQAQAASAGERSAVVDGIIDLLNHRAPTRERLEELVPAIDTERGIPDFIWAPDQTLAGPPADDDQVVEITCQACCYVNKLRYRPPPDDPGDCQNPEKPRHLLKMA